ncbi:MAG: hypothetical protein ACI399_01300 [Candidatus Cryptobacteroides sp.]
MANEPVPDLKSIYLPPEVTIEAFFPCDIVCTSPGDGLYDGDDIIVP